MGRQYIVVFITTKDRQEADCISGLLLEKKLAACVNIVPEVHSAFFWEGKIDSATEALLVIKSRSDLLDPLVRTVRATHSYSICEIIALPIMGGNEDYLKWIDDSLKEAAK